MTLEFALRAQPGVRSATVNLTRARAFVEYDSHVTGPAALSPFDPVTTMIPLFVTTGSLPLGSPRSEM